MDTHGGRGSSPERGIKVPYRDIFTALYKNFQQTYDDYKQDIFDERKCLKTKEESILI